MTIEEILKAINCCYDADCEHCPNNSELGSGEIVCLHRLLPKIEDCLNDKDQQIAELKQQLEHYKGTKLEDYSNEIRELKQKLEAKDRNCLALFGALYDVLEKQDPENVSTRIDFLTKQDNGKINDIYKEWRVLKQQLADAEEHIDTLEL